MRTSIATAALLLLAATLLLPACQPYEDGPKISFRSKEKRMNFSRPIASYTVDGVDSLEGLETSLIEATDSSYERGMVLLWFHNDDETSSNICGQGADPYACFGKWGFTSVNALIWISLPGLPTTVLNNNRWEIQRLSKTEFRATSNAQGLLREISLNSIGYE